VRIEKLLYGGQGLAHVDGRALLVPFTAPGDLLRVRIEETGRRVLRGSIESVLEPAPSRRSPACAHFGACGGCHLQHLDREGELGAKAEFLRDCLGRIAGVRWDGPIDVESGADYAWRSRVALHVLREPDVPPRVGYFRSGSREIVPIEECPVLVPALREAVAGFRRSPASIPEGADRIDLVAGDDGRVGSSLSMPAAVRQRITGFELELEAGVFSQANPAMADRLVRRALGEERGERAVDLYAGSGLFSLPLAARFGSVEAVESDERAVRLGVRNGRANGIENVRWSRARVRDWLEAARRGLRPDLVLLDPPRAGAGPEVVDRILDLAPRRIVYVACDPATWARDLRRFVERGSTILEIAAVDLFPRSYHVEALARLAPAPGA
jgi:23S rRNA (uracil1939-C5)-methyltransferase